MLEKKREREKDRKIERGQRGKSFTFFALLSFSNVHFLFRYDRKFSLYHALGYFRIERD